MEDILIIILLVVMMTAGMVLFFGGLVALAINGYRSMRRSRPPAEQQVATGVEAKAFVIRQNQDLQDVGIHRIGPIGDGDTLILIIRKSGKS